MKRELDYALSQLVEEIERVEATRRKFGGVFKQIKDTTTTIHIGFMEVLI